MNARPLAVDDLNDPAILKAYRTKRRSGVDNAPVLVALMETYSPILLKGMAREFQFCERKWRFDLAYPAHLLAIEIQGGRWKAGGGRHMTAGDFEKMQRACALGWRVFPVLPAQLKSDPLRLLEMIGVSLGYAVIVAEEK